MASNAKSLVLAAALTAIGSGAAAAPAGSSLPERVDAEELLALLEQIQAAAPTSSPQNYGVSGGYGLPQGAFAISGTLTDQGSPQNDDTDGSISLGIGIGDPINAVGLDVVVNIVSTDFDDFAEDGDLGLKLHRVLPGFVPGGSSSVAVGVTQASTWGDSDLADPNYYGSFSTYLPMPTGVSSLVTIGYGSNVDSEARLTGAVFDTDESVFGSLGIGWNQYLDSSVSWNGTELLAGIGVRPFPSENLVVTAGIGDITDRTDNRRALLTVAWFKPNLF